MYGLFLDAVALVDLFLRCTDFIGGRQFFKIGIANTHLSQLVLQSFAVHESILASTNPSSLPDITKGIDTVLCQFAEKLLLR